ncbi:hypothetical protein, partial [Burkholderia pseudomallei]
LKMDWEIIDSLSVSSIKNLAASTRMRKKSSPEPTGEGATQRTADAGSESDPTYNRWFQLRRSRPF